MDLKLKQLNDSQHFQDIKKDMTNKVMSLAIPVIGVEPILPQRELDFESSASANSATPAYQQK
ncbi:hypothetical protein IV43_GL000157 [Ligilactobacillus acidipiscis]|uniref:Uncharacterized protein n=1 Tax=Ligilactobacillus acidipiscis TaxID=89059 RepID=A0A0R2JUZ5_9LACO|nr:hypothetical protein IV43_GL000157 [Ligilactobacillus acidipiscis]